MIFYQYFVNIVRQTIIGRRRLGALVIYGNIYFCERHFIKEDIEFTSKIVSDFPLVCVLLCKDLFLFELYVKEFLL